MQIIGLLVAYASMLIVFYTLLHLIKLDRQEKRKKCMKNHPAGKHVKTEHLPIGLMEEISLAQTNNDLAIWKAHHLEGD